MTKIAILGAGSWGTALSIILSRSGRKHDIALWARDADLAAAIEGDRENKRYLPGCKIPPNVAVTTRFAKALDHSAIVICAVPSAHVRRIFGQAAPHLAGNAAIVS